MLQQQTAPKTPPDIQPGQLYEVTVFRFDGSSTSALFLSLEAAGEYSDQESHNGCYGTYLGVWNGGMIQNQLYFDRIPFQRIVSSNPLACGY